MNLKVFYAAAILLLKLNILTSAKSTVECGYKQCPQSRDGALNVHLIPHSHMDAGWVKTFDEYYYGTKTSVSTANVQLIYHSVLSELLHDKMRRFTLSETGYFWRWWKEQRPATRATFRTLVQEGRLEFAGGGWVQNDEATTDYLQIIDQYTWGLRKLNDTLGPCGKPKAAWQIDTYGHSREQASLLAQMGFDGLFLGRVDHKKRESMIAEDRLEFMWRGSDVLGKMSDIMSHVLFNLYNAPDGFCFDFLCNDEPIIDDPDSTVYNADARMNDLIAQIERQAKYYDHDNIILTMGGDFTYQSAANWFMNMDKLINHVTTHPANISDINIFYSTPSCYLKSIYLYGRRDKAIYTERGDLFPYGSDSLTYWTGFYSSRPALKYLIRRAHVFLQVIKQLTVISRTSDSYELHFLRHAVSLVLHHDAITGTSQQHVTNDYIRMLSDAIQGCSKKVSTLLSRLTPTWGATRRSKNSQQFVICHHLNISQCRFTETQESLLVMVYNPLSLKTYFHVRLPAIALHYSIRDYNDEEVEYQLVPLPAAITNAPGRNSAALQELCFEAENIPPLGFTVFYVAPVRDQLEENNFAKKSSQDQLDIDSELVPYISNEFLKVTVNRKTGLLESIQHVDGMRIEVSQNFYYYSQKRSTLQSGAYSFRPERQIPTSIAESVTYNTIRGSLVKEIRQRFTDWLSQSIRLHRGEEYVELEWIIGPVPLGSDLGKEIVTIFATNISNDGEFFTDSNARQMMKRSCLNVTTGQKLKKPVASCYYPVSSRICIHSTNSSAEVCVMADRPQGGTSYNQGEIELMVHRRLLTDDGFGLEETLNEEEHGSGLVVRGKHRILFGNYKHEVEDQTFSEKVSAAARRWKFEPWLFFASGDKLNRRKWQNVRNKRFSALKLHGLPRHVHVLTLEPWKSGSVLLRLENTLETPIRDMYKSDGANHPEDFNATPTHVTVDLRKLFLSLEIRQVRETTLAANQWLDDARQMDWSTRYMYTGADDGMLPEDAEETRDVSHRQSENRESDPSSYEDDQNPTPRAQQKKRRFRTKQRNPEEYRRKRSLNVTENINENIINDTNNDSNSNDTERVTLRNDTKILYSNDTINPSLIVDRATTKITSRPASSKMTTRRPELERLDSLEVTSSEEKIYKRRKSKSGLRDGSAKKIKSDVIHQQSTEELDDGVTKSIYDMYYRHKPRASPFREDNNKNIPRKNSKRPQNFRENVGSVRKGRLAKKRRQEKGASYFADGSYEMEKKEKPKERRSHKTMRRNYSDEHSEESEESGDVEKGVRRRRKRSSKSERETSAEDEASQDTEYIITLRPTQIRTFVIWFHPERKKYK